MELHALVVTATTLHATLHLQETVVQIGQETKTDLPTGTANGESCMQQLGDFNLHAVNAIASLLMYCTLEPHATGLWGFGKAAGIDLPLSAIQLDFIQPEFYSAACVCSLDFLFNPAVDVIQGWPFSLCCCCCCCCHCSLLESC